MNHTDSLEQLHLHLQHLADTLISLCARVQKQDTLKTIKIYIIEPSNKWLLQQQLHLWSRGEGKHFWEQGKVDLHMTDYN